MIIGITGGMGCGKSSAAQLFSQRGFTWMDSDSLIRERILCDSGILSAIRDKFGEAAVFSEGKLDRHKLAQRVFTCDAARLWLEGVTHPRLFTLWREALWTAPRSMRWVIEVPLLFEKCLENWFDLTVCVASSPTQQIARLEQRGVARKFAEQRILKQLPLATKLSLADVVLWNDGALTSLQYQVEQVISQFSHAL